MVVAVVDVRNAAEKMHWRQRREHTKLAEGTDNTKSSDVDTHIVVAWNIDAHPRVVNVWMTDCAGVVEVVRHFLLPIPSHRDVQQLVATTVKRTATCVDDR